MPGNIGDRDRLFDLGLRGRGTVAASWPDPVFSWTCYLGIKLSSDSLPGRREDIRQFFSWRMGLAAI